MSLRDQIFQEYLRKLELEDIHLDLIKDIADLWESQEGITKEKLLELLEVPRDD